MTKKNRIISLCERYTAEKIAEKTGCGTAYIYRTCKLAGLNIKSAPPRIYRPNPFKGQAGKSNPFKTHRRTPHAIKEDDHYDHLQRMKRHEQWRREHAVELAVFYVKREYDLS